MASVAGPSYRAVPGAPVPREQDDADEDEDYSADAGLCWQILNEQRGILLWLKETYPVPMGVLWLSALGGSLQAPVLSFFYLRLGLSPVSIGTAGFITTGGALLLTPMYGYILDNYSAMGTLVLTTSLCGVGCLVRGLAASEGAVFAAASIMGVGGASFEAMTLALVTRGAPAEMRPSVVSGFMTQVLTLPLTLTRTLTLPLTLSY